MNTDQLLRAVAPAAAATCPVVGRGPLVWRKVRGTSSRVLAASLHHEWGLPLDLLFATDDRADGRGIRRARRVRGGPRAPLPRDSRPSLPAESPAYPSVTARVMAAHWYERYAQDMFGIRALGHPDDRRLVHHENVPPGTHPLRKDFRRDTRLARAPTSRTRWDGWRARASSRSRSDRFTPASSSRATSASTWPASASSRSKGSCSSPTRGSRSCSRAGPSTEALPLVERVSGDSAASHALAFCQAVESAAGLRGARTGARHAGARGGTRAVHDAPARFRQHLRDGHRVHGHGRQRLPHRRAAAAAVGQARPEPVLPRPGGAGRRGGATVERATDGRGGHGGRDVARGVGARPPGARLGYAARPARDHRCADARGGVGVRREGRGRARVRRRSRRAAHAPARGLPPRCRSAVGRGPRATSSPG